MLKTGILGRASLTVTGENTARAMGSGALPVLATPAVAALVEQAAWQSVQPELEPGCGTVGTRLDLAHKAATPVGGRSRPKPSWWRSTAGGWCSASPSPTARAWWRTAPTSGL